MRAGVAEAQRHPTRTLVVLAGAALALSQTMIVPALPAIQRASGADPADVTWLLTAFLLTSSVGTPLLGRLGDTGLFLLPSSVLMLFAGPAGGSLGARFGSKLPLGLGSVFAGSGYFWLAAAHDTRLEIYVGSALLGLGIGLAFAAMANLVVEAVPQEQTGSATAVNSIMRTIGGAVGAQVAGALLAAHLVAGGLPAEAGFTNAFLMSGAAAIVALAATTAIPSPIRRGRSRRATEAPGR